MSQSQLIKSSSILNIITQAPSEPQIQYFQ